MKRILSFICALVLLFTSLPGATVFAAEATAVSSQDILAESNDEELIIVATEEVDLFPDLRPDVSAPKTYKASQGDEFSDSLMDYLLVHFGNCESQFSIEQFNIPFSQWIDLTTVIYYNTPELFHLKGLGCSYGGESNIIKTISAIYRTHADTADEYQTCLKKMRDGADYLLQGVKGNDALTEVEKALILHDRLAVWTEYDLGNVNTADVDHKIFAAYSALGEGLSVCQGYAMAYMYLLEQVGIKSEYCSSSELYHGWNIVYIDGVAYHVDVTWDDPTNGSGASYYDVYGRVFHNNFLLSTDGIRATGHTAGDFNTAPKDSRYDGKNDATWWKNSDTAVQLIGNKLYYQDSFYGNVVAPDDGTQVHGHEFYYSTCMLSGAAGLLLCATSEDVHAVDPISAATSVVYTPTTGYIEGMKYEKGKLYVQLTDGNGNHWRESVDYVAPEMPEVPDAADYTYTVENGEATITGYTGAGGAITIPATLGGYPVTQIGDEVFWGCTGMTSVEIPNTVTAIGDYAFCYCTNLTSVTIPDSVKTIGEYAFAGYLDEETGDFASSLTSVTIGSGVTTIGADAFSACGKLTSLTIPDNVTRIDFGAFCFCYNLNSVTIGKGITAIPDFAFRACENLTTVTIPASVTAIGENAFSYCTKLTDVYYDGTESQWNSIPAEDGNECLQSANIHFAMQEEVEGTEYTYIVENGEATITGYNGTGGNVTIPDVLGGYPVTCIGECAFYGCSNLASVAIPDTVTKIGADAFAGCIHLTSVTIPDSITAIYDGTFYYCESLTTVTIPDSVTYVGEGAFDNCNITKLIVAEGAKTITDTMVVGKATLNEVVLPNTLTKIGDWALYSCNNLTTVNIPDSVTVIGEGAFYGCSNLASITIPNSVTKIGVDAFAGCIHLTSVTLPDSISVIYDGTFYYCESLMTVTIPDSVTGIGENAFYYCYNLKDVYYDGTEEQWNSISVESGNEYLQNATIHFPEPENTDYTYSVENGEATITGYTGAGGDITIPSTLGGYPVTTIDDTVFEQNDALTSVVIPGTVKTIGFGAFRYCANLASVTLGEGIVDIGIQTFMSCTGLTSITIPDSVTEIGADVFYECTGLEEVTIGSGVTSIGESAFRFCESLKAVELPASVTSIGNLAFYFCENLSAFSVHEDNAFFASERGVLFNKNKTVLLQAPMKISGKYVLPESVTEVAKSAFSGCVNLTEIDLGTKVKTIGAASFADTAITSVVIPDSVTTLGEAAFRGCSELKSFTIGTGITEIPDNAFYYSGLNSVTIPDHITVIGKAAFDTCPGLTELTLPAGLTLVKEGAFDTCYYLENVYYKGTRRQWEFMTIQERNDILFSAYVHCADEPETSDAMDFVYEINNGEATIVRYKGEGGNIEISPIWAGYPVTAIADEAFYWNTLITGVNIPGTVKRIGNHAFFNCVNMTALTLNEGIQVIGKEAFSACTKLTEIEIPDSVNKIGNKAFCYCTNLQNIVLGKGVQDVGVSVWSQCSELVSIQVKQGNVYLRDIDGVLFKGTTLIQYPANHSKNYTVPDGTTAIGNSAFFLCDELQAVTLPDSVTVIDSEAFSECYSLTEIRIGKGVQTIGYRAFYWIDLETVCFAGTKAQWDLIDIQEGNESLLQANIVFEGDHVHSYTQQVTNPTCTAKGYTTYTCECGDTYTDNETKALGHSYKSGKCTRCSYKPAGAKITTQPVNAVVANGKTAKVTVKATGDGLKCTWYYAKKGSSKFTKTTVTSASYSVKMSNSVNGGKVYCQITDKYGNSVKSATVTLYKGTPAKITTQPKGITVVGGKTGKLEIKASGSSLKYQWYVKYKGASSYTKVGKSNKTYSFKMASKFNGAQAYCVVTDKYGISVKSTVVTIKMPAQPKVTTQPKSVTQVSGKTVKFTVKASGEGLKYQWYYAKKGSNSFKKLSGKTSATYSVKVSKSVNGYKYYCVVTDKYGQTVKSSAVTLTMKTVAKITTQPKNVTMKNGKTAKVTIKAEGDGLKYTWYYLKPGATKYVKASATGATYSVKMAAAWKNTKVYCVIADKYGNTVKSNVVTLKMK